MAKKFRIRRRALLTGAAGAAIALPLLEAREGEAEANTNRPLRYVVSFAGVSLVNGSVPAQTGGGYAMTPALLPLEPLRDQLLLVSGLDVPAAGEKNVASSIPAGGRPAGPFHNNSVTPILTGHKGGVGPSLSHPTSDQLVADQIGNDTPIHSLQLRVQAEAYVGGYGMMSSSGTSGSAAPLPPIANPLVAYETLFAGFTPPAGTTVIGQTLEQRRSVLDLVDRRTERLLTRVSHADRIRLEAHYDAIRELENKLADVMAPPTGSGCQAPASPTVPAAGSAYSNEDERGRLMSDMLHMALVCDLTRVASFMLTFAQCQMSAEPLVGHGYACHELTHSVAQQELGANGKAKWGEMNAWHCDQIAYLANKLRDTQEEDETLLDRTAVVLLFEAGTTSSHSTTNMVAVVLGRPDALQVGSHVNASGARPAHVLQTLMSVTGVDQPFGEVPGTVAPMLV
ncbi:MAG: DUF1552 domain-containing protein [Polyangiaceae bacterium]